MTENFPQTRNNQTHQLKNNFVSYLPLVFGLAFWSGLSLIRLINLEHESLWFDELATYYFSTKPLSEILRIDPGHPPLMSMVVFLWTKLTSSIDPFTLKLLPFIFGQLGLFMLFKVLRFNFNLTYSVLGTVLFLCFDSTFYFLSELRSYSITPFLFLGFYYYYHLKKKALPSLVFFLVGIYTHYTLALIFGLMILGHILKIKKVRREEYIFFLSALPALYFSTNYLFQDRPYYWKDQDYGVLNACLEFITSYLTGNYNYILESYFTIPLFIMTLLGIYALLKKKDFSTSYPLLIGVLAPFLLIIILSLGPYEARFYQATLPSYAVAITFIFSSFKRQKISQWAMCLLILALGQRYFDFDRGFFAHHRKPQWGPEIQKLSEAPLEAQKIYVFPNATTSFNIFKYYNDYFFDKKEVVVYRAPQQVIVGFERELTNYALYQKPLPKKQIAAPYLRIEHRETPHLVIFKLKSRYH